MREPFRVLGVPPGATLPEIRRAYRRIAFETHPDRDPSPAAAARFREASEAYQLLRTPASAAPAQAAAAGPSCVEVAVARAFSTFVEDLAGRVSADGAAVDVEFYGARVRVKLRRTPQ